MIEEDDIINNLTQEERDQLINQLAEHRELKTKGVRANNVAAAHDMTATSDAMIKQVSNQVTFISNASSYTFF